MTHPPTQAPSMTELPSNQIHSESEPFQLSVELGQTHSQVSSHDLKRSLLVAECDIIDMNLKHLGSPAYQLEQPESCNSRSSH